MFSLFPDRSRTSPRDVADGAVEQLLALARRIRRQGGEAQTLLASAPDHLRTAARQWDRLGIDPMAVAGTGRLAMRHVGRNPSLLAPILIVGAAVAVGYWLARPSEPAVSAPYVKRGS